MKLVTLITIAVLSISTSAALKCKKRLKVEVLSATNSSEYALEGLQEKFSSNLYLRSQDLFSCKYANSKTKTELNVELEGEKLNLHFKNVDAWHGRRDYNKEVEELITVADSLIGTFEMDNFVEVEGYDDGCGFTECPGVGYYEEERRLTDQKVTIEIK